MGTGRGGYSALQPRCSGRGQFLCFTKTEQWQLQQDGEGQEENSFLIPLWGSGHVLEWSGDPCLGTEVQTLLKVVKPSGYFQASYRIWLNQLKTIPKVSTLLCEATFPPEFTNFLFHSVLMAEIFPEL